MASLAFLIPLKRIGRIYIKLCASKMCIKTPFAHFSNAQCYYRALENTKPSSVVCAYAFYYKSRLNSKLDFKPHNIFHYFYCIRMIRKKHDSLSMWTYLMECWIFAISYFFAKPPIVGKPIANNHALCNNVKIHFARYPTDFQ